MAVKIFSRFTQTAQPTSPQIAIRQTIAITAPDYFVAFPFPLFDTTYNVRYSCYVGQETVGCDQLRSEQEINGFWVHPLKDATLTYEIIIG